MGVLGEDGRGGGGRNDTGGRGWDDGEEERVPQASLEARRRLKISGVTMLPEKPLDTNMNRASAEFACLVVPPGLCNTNLS